MLRYSKRGREISEKSFLSRLFYPSEISDIKWGIVESLPNPPHGLPFSGPMGKSSIDTWHHFVLLEIYLFGR